VNSREAIPKKKRRKNKQMFVIPSHLSDPTLYCRELKQSLTYSSPLEVTQQKEKLWHEMCLSPERHTTLSMNLGLNPEDVPWNIQELLDIYHRAKTEVQNQINATLEKQTRKLNKRISTSRERAERERLEELQNIARDSSREFVCKWKPLLEESMRANTALDVWAEPLLEIQQETLQEIKKWKKVGFRQEFQMLTLSVTFRDKESRVEQRQEFQVSNELFVEELLSLVQQRMAIVLEPGQELRLFTTRGPVKSNTQLNQYDSEKIASLKLFRIQPEDEKAGENF
jgi:hypothetical protein